MRHCSLLKASWQSASSCRDGAMAVREFRAIHSEESLDFVSALECPGNRVRYTATVLTKETLASLKAIIVTPPPKLASP
jgi:hypothetical protein